MPVIPVTLASSKAIAGRVLFFTYEIRNNYEILNTLLTYINCSFKVEKNKWLSDTGMHFFTANQYGMTMGKNVSPKGVRFIRKTAFNCYICYYGQVNSLCLKSSVASKWASKHLKGNIYFAGDGKFVV